MVLVLSDVTSWVDSLTPEQRFDLLTADLTPEERETARAYLAEQQRSLQEKLQTMDIVFPAGVTEGVAAPCGGGLAEP